MNESSKNGATDILMERADAYREKIGRIRNEIAKAIVGHSEVIEEILICLLADGHALVEGVPGLGKTYLIRTLGEVLRLESSRIQFTPDLMPADIIGTDVLVEESGEHASGRTAVRFQKGPVFTQVLLADEINRATPKTQSALLEAMQERKVTVGGIRYDLTPPFIVLATQNPIEMEGTYPLPEAQLDRFFFKLSVRYPSREDIHEILERTTAGDLPVLTPVVDGAEVVEMQRFIRGIPVPVAVQDYAVRLVLATHPEGGERPDIVSRYVRYGASPRGAQSLVLAGKCLALFDGRFNAAFSDIRRAAFPALRHRVLLGFEGEAEGVSPEDIVRAVLEHVPETLEKTGVTKG